MMHPSTSISIFTIISILIICCCFILGCCGCILSRRKYRKSYQNQFINNRYASEAHPRVFTLEMPYTQPSNDEQLPSQYSSDKSPLSYETVAISVPSATQSTMLTTTDGINQIQQK